MMGEMDSFSEHAVVRDRQPGLPPLALNRAPIITTKMCSQPGGAGRRRLVAAQPRHGCNRNTQHSFCLANTPFVRLAIFFDRLDESLPTAAVGHVPLGALRACVPTDI